MQGAHAGSCQCRDILEGTYLPAVSMYTMVRQSEGARATFNFGEASLHWKCVLV